MSKLDTWSSVAAFAESVTPEPETLISASSAPEGDWGKVATDANAIAGSDVVAYNPHTRTQAFNALNMASKGMESAIERLATFPDTKLHDIAVKLLKNINLIAQAVKAEG